MVLAVLLFLDFRVGLVVLGGHLGLVVPMGREVLEVQLGTKKCIIKNCL